MLKTNDHLAASHRAYLHWLQNGRGRAIQAEEWLTPAALPPHREMTPQECINKRRNEMGRSVMLHIGECHVGPGWKHVGS